MGEDREDGTRQRTEDEDPDLVEGRAAVLQEGGSERTGGVDRGAGQVDPEQMDQRQRQADDQSDDEFVVGLGSDPEDRIDEDEGQDDFDEEPQQEIQGEGGSREVRDAVRPEGGIGTEEDHQDEASKEGSQHLGEDVESEILEGELFGQIHGEGHRRIDVASGDVADGVGHRHDGKPEGQRGGHEIDAAFDGDPATEGDEDEGSDEFGEIRFPILHEAVSRSLCRGRCDVRVHPHRITIAQGFQFPPAVNRMRDEFCLQTGRGLAGDGFSL